MSGPRRSHLLPSYLVVRTIYRWYRAPELICSYFTRYSAAVDVWAAGCICAELLRRKPLFPGHSVYHQIELITNLTGTPTEEEISKVRNQKAREYLSSLAVKPRPDWHPLFPGCHPLSVDLLTTLLTFDPDLRQSAAEAMNHPYFEMFKNVGHDRLAVPPPVMTKADFSWESEKSLTKQQLREILYQEIAKYHPERESEEHHARFAPTASNEVREQISALERGDKPARATSTSMPAEQTAPLFAQVQKMASQGTLEETEMIDVGEECSGSEMGSPVHRVPVPSGVGESHDSDSMRMDGDDDVLPDEYAVARPQTISADDVAKLASSAVESITPGIDEEAMDHAALSMADAATRGASWQELSQRQRAAGTMAMGVDSPGKPPSPVQVRTRGSRVESVDANGSGVGTGRSSSRGGGGGGGGGGSGGSSRTSGRGATGGTASKDLLDVMRDKKMKRQQAPSHGVHHRDDHTGGEADAAADEELDLSPREHDDAEVEVEEYYDDESEGEGGDGRDDDDDDAMMGHDDEDGEGELSSADEDEESDVDGDGDGAEGPSSRDRGNGNGRSDGGGTGGGGGEEEEEGEQCILQ